MEHQFTTGAEVRAALLATPNTGERTGGLGNFWLWWWCTHLEGKPKPKSDRLIWIREIMLTLPDEELIFLWAVYCMNGRPRA